MEINQVTYSVKAAAKRYGCSRGFITKQIDDGKLRALKIGERWFIPKEELDCLFLGKCGIEEAA